MKVTGDSLDQLETKNSDTRNRDSTTVHAGEQNAVQQSFTTIPFSYLNE
jgi:hypothetical protein